MNKPNNPESLVLCLHLRSVVDHINSLKHFEIQVSRITQSEIEA